MIHNVELRLWLMMLVIILLSLIVKYLISSNYEMKLNRIKRNWQMVIIK